MQQMPLTNPYPGPRSVLILDNCNIHHAKEVRQLVEDDAGIMLLPFALFFPDIHIGCRLLYLPPYSPDFNPIEEAFASMKAFLRRNFTDTSLMSIVHAFARITPEMASGWFYNSGYVV